MKISVVLSETTVLVVLPAFSLNLSTNPSSRLGSVTERIKYYYKSTISTSRLPGELYTTNTTARLTDKYLTKGIARKTGVVKYD